MSKGVNIAFTQSIAAWQRHPYTEPVVTSAYVSRLPGAVDLDQLGLRSVTEGGKLWLHVPDDEDLRSKHDHRVRTCMKSAAKSGRL